MWEKIYGYGSAGGIVGSAFNTVIQNCYNSGEIDGDSYCYDTGGIAGMIRDKSQILSCYNIGNIYGYYIVGGIVGDAGDTEYSNEGSENIVNNCYNKGNIKGTISFDIKVGGIVGADNATEEIKNSYNVGKIEVKEGTNVYIGGVIGHHKGFLENLFFINTAGPSYGCGKNEASTFLEEDEGSTMETIKNLTNKLNGTQRDNPWKEDKKNINEGYPILSWQEIDEDI